MRDYSVNFCFITKQIIAALKVLMKISYARFILKEI
jgi:hypothetical protein